jgi:hypothetical protein
MNTGTKTDVKAYILGGFGGSAGLDIATKLFHAGRDVRGVGVFDDGACFTSKFSISSAPRELLGVLTFPAFSHAQLATFSSASTRTRTMQRMRMVGAATSPPRRR